MTELITGGSGRLGKELIKVFPKAKAPSHKELDITEKPTVFEYIKTSKPETIIHAAALTGINQCESDKSKAWATNVQGTENLIDACVRVNQKVYFIYVSTACVFDGRRGMYTEEDLPYPDNFYSLTKLLGEFVVKKLEKHLIVRTNFVARERWAYQRAFIDRFGTYLFADQVAKGIRDVIQARLVGVVHIVGDRKLSMFELAKMTTPDIKPMTLKDYTGPNLTIDMTLDTILWKKYRIDNIK